MRLTAGSVSSTATDTTLLLQLLPLTSVAFTITAEFVYVLSTNTQVDVVAHVTRLPDMEHSRWPAPLLARRLQPAGAETWSRRGLHVSEDSI